MTIITSLNVKSILEKNSQTMRIFFLHNHKSMYNLYLIQQGFSVLFYYLFPFVKNHFLKLESKFRSLFNINSTFFGVKRKRPSPCSTKSINHIRHFLAC